MRAGLLFGAGFLLALVPAGATIVPRLSLEEMVDRSDMIVHGRCLRTWPAWDAERQAIWTHSEIEVADPLKGEPARTVVVSEPGGSVDGVEMTVEGMPRYHAGDELILFLYRAPNGLFRARGLGQGKYNVTADRKGIRRVRADLNGVSVIEPSGPVPKGTELDGLEIQLFKSRLRGAIARQMKGSK